MDEVVTTGISFRADAMEAAARQRCVLDVYGPADREAGWPVVVWFYGGGLTMGERHIPEALRGQGLVVVTPDYRLAPAARSPAYLDDAAAAVAWAQRCVAQYGGDPRRLWVAGASAGGYLAAMVTLDRRWLAAAGGDADQIAGLVSMTGQMVTHFTIRAERGLPLEQPVVDEWAPLYHVRGDAPPILLTTGDRRLELPGRYEENAYMQAMLRARGHRDVVLHEIEAADHGAVEAASHPLMLAFMRERF